MLHVTTALWAPNLHSAPFSTSYDESWVEKLYRGFRRNLTEPFRFVAFVDTERQFKEPAIEQEILVTQDPDYGAQIECFRLNEPMIFCQLDSIIVGNCDLFAEYCLTSEKIALNRDPYVPARTVTGVALVPAGHRHVYDSWTGATDLTHMRRQNTACIEDIWPKRRLVLSYKAQVQQVGGIDPDTRIVYTHGRPKPPDMTHIPWARKNWV